MECLKFMKDVFRIAFLLMLKQYYQISYQLIKNPVVQIMTNHRKNSWNNKDFVDTVFKDLSKAFNTIPHDLLAAKLHAYSLSKDAVTFLYSY